MFQGSSEEELNSITFEESIKHMQKTKEAKRIQISGNRSDLPVVLNRCAEKLAVPLNALFTKSF